MENPNVRPASEPPLPPISSDEGMHISKIYMGKEPQSQYFP